MVGVILQLWVQWSRILQHSSSTNYNTTSIIGTNNKVLGYSNKLEEQAVILVEYKKT